MLWFGTAGSAYAMPNGLVQKMHSGRKLIASRTVQSAMQWCFLPVFNFSIRLRRRTPRQRALGMRTYTHVKPKGSPPEVRRIGVLFWRAPPLLMSLCCFRRFRRDQMACAPVHVSPGAICLNYAVKLRARLVCGALWCVSSWCLANVPDVKR